MIAHFTALREEALGAVNEVRLAVVVLAAIAPEFLVGRV